MDCRDRILSNNYFDVITDFPVRILDENEDDLCYINIENLYNIVYLSETDIRNANDYIFDYRRVPKLYGLMQEEAVNRGFDPNSLIVSGITQVQRAPLSLTGRGVVICVIDTGDGVSSLSGGEFPENTCFGFTVRAVGQYGRDAGQSFSISD